MADDQITRMIEVLKDPALDETDKDRILGRFKYRRIMAFLALATIILTLAWAIYMGTFKKTLDAGVSNLITWIVGFLAAIVAAYFGTTLKPR